MTTISILGSGWLGLPLAQHLRQAGHQVRASTRTPARLAELQAVGLDACLVDIDNIDDTVTAFLDADVLIINITSKNIEAFRQLAGRIESSPVRQVLFTSSTSVYAASNGVASEAAAELNHDSPLLTIEKLLQDWSGFATTIVRLAGLVGGRRHPGRFFRSGKVVSAPRARVNLVHRDDCIAVMECIITRGAWGEIFNCCADTHPTKREYYTQAAQSIGQPVPEFDEASNAAYKLVSNDRLRQVLDYEFKYPDVNAMLHDPAAFSPVQA